MCVGKLCMSKLCERELMCTTQNKNPTQSCGEQLNATK